MELSRTVIKIVRQHYPEYLMEAAGLGLFMISASVVTAAMEHPASLLHQGIADPLLRRFLIGVAMGLTAIALVYSPWGQQSGAHLNPAVTLTFWHLGKVKGWDALFYVLAQFCGGWAGMRIAAGLLGEAIAHPRVNYIVTVPGQPGPELAFGAEVVIAFGLMLMVLVVSNHPRLAPLTGLFAGLLVALFITVEAPLSGTSMNPARSVASALVAWHWTAIWIYFVAPLTGMAVAANVYRSWQGRQAVKCAKLFHQTQKRCIFCCNYLQSTGRSSRPTLSDRLPDL